MAKPGAKILELPNLGPVSRDMLASAGIKTLGQLRALGSVQAYAKVKRLNPMASLNLLWALEGALAGKSWKEVAHTDRERLLDALSQLSLHLPTPKRRGLGKVQ